ncbi:MAG: hypothetical protein RR229_00635 [Oscillospiraceae bacterium]
MLKVSLLPASYRKHIDGKKKKDLILKIAFVFLVCALIIYVGVLAKGMILDSKLSKIQTENVKLEQQFPALQKYQEIFNSLKKSQEMIKAITPADTEAVAFVTEIFNIAPDYVQIMDVNIENWFTAGICTINCTAQDYSDAQDFLDLFRTEEMAKTIKLAEMTNITRGNSTDGVKSVTFTIALSLSNAIKVTTQAPQIVTVTDKKGVAVTDTEGKVETSVVAPTAATTAASGDSTTAGTGTTAPATTAKGGKK